MNCLPLKRGGFLEGLERGLNRGFTVHVPYLLTNFKFLFFVPYVFLGLFVYRFQTTRHSQNFCCCCCCFQLYQICIHFHANRVKFEKRKPFL